MFAWKLNCYVGIIHLHDGPYIPRTLLHRTDGTPGCIDVAVAHGNIFQRDSE
jgi:hypothetical protein